MTEAKLRQIDAQVDKLEVALQESVANLLPLTTQQVNMQYKIYN